MQVSLTAALDTEQLDSLMTVLDDAEMVLGAFTEEELALLEPPQDERLVPLPLVDAVPDGEARDQVLAGAFRSLVARGLVELGVEPGELYATGSLSTLLSVRSAPNSLLIVEHVEEEDPSRVVVYGLPVETDRGVETLLMEESVAVLGHHEFVLRSVESQAAALTEWLGVVPPEAPAGNGHPHSVTRERLDAALDDLRAVTRLHALKRDDDGTGEGDYKEVELTLVDGGEHGRFMVLFQTADDDTEGMLAVPVEALDLQAFFAGLLRLDLTPFNEALAAS